MADPVAQASSAPWLLVGLGNPGPKYAANRHNVGFMAVEQWFDREREPGADWRDKFHGRMAIVSGAFGRCVVLLPLTFMNVSGKSVAAAKAFYQVPDERLVVVHDELDFVFGRLAVKRGGGHGGHNGLRDIIATTGSSEFVRVRVGIGRPEHGDVTRWVLSDFGPEDRAELPDLLDRARGAITAILRRGVQAAMNEFNTPQGGRS